MLNLSLLYVKLNQVKQNIGGCEHNKKISYQIKNYSYVESFIFDTQCSLPSA